MIAACAHEARGGPPGIATTDLWWLLRLKGDGRFLLTSCRSGQLANDATRRNGTSLFTQHLVDGLLNAVPDGNGDGYFDPLHV